ncbi:NfeD family protein [Pararhodonellum marinum]|uniref:NfeD family protein n=1 Tax=Pararhodonellum marinum TaxID=2755358 RepID=UPI00188E514C|nr:NfeD family protein [Pararhodonellum marinum]
MTWFLLISLLTIGLILVLVEILFVPGTTIVGILGLLVSAAGIYYGFMVFEASTAWTILGLMVLAHTGLLVYGFSSGVWTRFALKETMSSRSHDDRLLGLEVGMKGKAISDIKPFGKAEFGDIIYEVKSESGFVRNGTAVIIHRLENNKIIIKS